MLKTVAEIDLDKLASNVRAICSQVSPARVIAVVKADAYGHGAVTVAKRLVREGIDFFAVAQLKEAMELRDSGLRQPVLVFERLFPDEILTAVKAGFRISVFGKQDIQWIENSGCNAPADIHVKLETGMGRVGLLYNQEPDFFNRLVHSRYCRWEGLYSHFSTADERDKTYASLQLSRFNATLLRLKALPRQPSLIHMANSAAVLDIPQSYFGAVRTGILIYGDYPSGETTQSIHVKQVMTLKTTVTHIRRISAGYPVSYGRRWTAKERTRIAVLPVGYADGIRRSLMNQGEVLIRGRRYPVVGAVTMDQTMIDVGEGSPVEPGDEAVIWGDSGQETIRVSDVAEKIGTIPYEVLCNVSARVKRVYKEKQ